MDQLIGGLLFIAGALIFASSLLAGTSMRPILAVAFRRAGQQQQRGLLAWVKSRWLARMDDVLRRSGRPAGWSADRLSRLSVLLASLGPLVALLSLLEGGVFELALVILLWGFVVGFYAPLVVMRVLAGRARVAEIEESVQLLKTLEVYLQNGYTLRAALEVSAGSLPHLGRRIHQSLLMWGQGPYRAIDQLVVETSDESARMVIAALKQAVDLGAGQLPIFLQREQDAIHRSQEALQKAQQARKPILFTLYLGFPLIGYATAFIMPFGITIASSITHIGGF